MRPQVVSMIKRCPSNPQPYKFALLATYSGGAAAVTDTISSRANDSDSDKNRLRQIAYNNNRSIARPPNQPSTEVGEGRSASLTNKAAKPSAMSGHITEGRMRRGGGEVISIQFMRVF